MSSSPVIELHLGSGNFTFRTRSSTILVQQDASANDNTWGVPRSPPTSTGTRKKKTVRWEADALPSSPPFQTAHSASSKQLIFRQGSTNPKYSCGILAPNHAVAHLLREKDVIDRTLGAYGFRGCKVKFGFRLGSGLDWANGYDGSDVGPPPVLREAITLVLPDLAGAMKESYLKSLMKDLAKHVSPYYGGVEISNSGERWELYSHSGVDVPLDDVLSGKCGSVPENSFTIYPPGEFDGYGPTVRLSYVFKLPEKDSGSSLATRAAFELVRDNRYENAYGLKCYDLGFEGPSTHSMHAVSVHFILDQPSEFREVSPKERRIAGRKSPKSNYGPPNANFVTTTPNPAKVRHSKDHCSHAIHYMFPFDRFSQRANFGQDVNLMPSIKFDSSGRRPPKKVTIRITSFWKSILDDDQGGNTARLGSVYTNFGSWANIEIPLDFIGHAQERVDLDGSLG